MQRASIEDNTLILQELIERCKRSDGCLAMVLLNLAKAFDTVSYNLIFKAPRRHRVHDHLINIVMDLYEGGYATFTTDDGTTAHRHPERSQAGRFILCHRSYNNAITTVFPQHSSFLEL